MRALNRAGAEGRLPKVMSLSEVAYIIAAIDEGGDTLSLLRKEELRPIINLLHLSTKDSFYGLQLADQLHVLEVLSSFEIADKTASGKNQNLASLLKGENFFANEMAVSKAEFFHALSEQPSALYAYTVGGEKAVFYKLHFALTYDEFLNASLAEPRFKPVLERKIVFKETSFKELIAHLESKNLDYIQGYLRAFGTRLANFGPAKMEDLEGLLRATRSLGYSFETLNLLKRQNGLIVDAPRDIDGIESIIHWAVKLGIGSEIRKEIMSSIDRRTLIHVLKSNALGGMLDEAGREFVSKDMSFQNLEDFLNEFSGVEPQRLLAIGMALSTVARNGKLPLASPLKLNELVRLHPQIPQEIRLLLVGILLRGADVFQGLAFPEILNSLHALPVPLRISLMGQQRSWKDQSFDGVASQEMLDKFTELSKESPQFFRFSEPQFLALYRTFKASGFNGDELPLQIQEKALKELARIEEAERLERIRVEQERLRELVNGFRTRLDRASRFETIISILQEIPPEIRREKFRKVGTMAVSFDERMNASSFRSFAELFNEEPHRFEFRDDQYAALLKAISAQNLESLLPVSFLSNARAAFAREEARLIAEEKARREEEVRQKLRREAEARERKIAEEKRQAREEAERRERAAEAIRRKEQEAADAAAIADAASATFNFVSSVVEAVANTSSSSSPSDGGWSSGGSSSGWDSGGSSSSSPSSDNDSGSSSSGTDWGGGGGGFDGGGSSSDW